MFWISKSIKCQSTFSISQSISEMLLYEAIRSNPHHLSKVLFCLLMLERGRCSGRWKRQSQACLLMYACSTITCDRTSSKLITTLYVYPYLLLSVLNISVNVYIINSKLCSKCSNADGWFHCLYLWSFAGILLTE